MKTFSCVLVLLSLMLSSFAQPGDPRNSSRSAAQYDASSISADIAYNRDIMYFSQMAVDRSKDAETKEIANEMLADFTELLYSVETLETSAGGKAAAAGVSDQAVELNEKLASVRGFAFDTLWIGGMLRMHQVKFIDLSEQKEKATDSRLKIAVTQAIPVVRRHITKLNSLQKQLIRQDLQEKKEAAKQLQKKGKK